MQITMYSISQTEFESIVMESISNIPKDYRKGLKNIAFFVEDEPSPEQRLKLGLRPCQSLFGLYEGVPLTERNGGYAFSLPDKITVYKNTHEQHSNSFLELKKQINKTVWHEVAHYYGLSHNDIDNLLNK